MFSLWRLRQDFEPLLEPVDVECFLSSEVVEWVVCVKPVAFGVDREVGNFGELGRLDKELLLRNECGDQSHFIFVEMKLTAVQLPIHVGVGEEQLRWQLSIITSSMSERRNSSSD